MIDLNADVIVSLTHTEAAKARAWLSYWLYSEPLEHAGTDMGGLIGQLENQISIDELRQAEDGPCYDGCDCLVCAPCWAEPVPPQAGATISSDQMTLDDLETT